MGKLSGADIDRLIYLLSDTLDVSDLRRFVHASTGDELFRSYTAEVFPLERMLDDVLTKLERQGTTVYFLAHVYEERAGRPDVRSLITGYFPQAKNLRDKRIYLSAQTAGSPQPDAPKNALAPGFERNLRSKIPQLDVRVWRDKLLFIERQICRIEMGGNALGTGFLVGPDTVLSNWHVFEIAKQAGKVGQLACRFDFLRLPGGALQQGKVIRLAQEARIDASPYSQAEMTSQPDDPLPTREELDYALLRLESAVGEEQVEGHARGWIKLPNSVLPLADDAPLLIVQHPEGSPMKLALDTEAVIGLNRNGTRLRYRTNTEGGSSGSPVFTMEWDIVALHHFGDPKWQRPLFNQGVPIELIRQRIDRNGFDSALGG